MFTTRSELVDLVNALNDLSDVQLRTRWGELKLMLHDLSIPQRKRDIIWLLINLLNKLEYLHQQDELEK